MAGDTVRDTHDRAREAYTTLAELGEGIDDEWSYVNALADAWRDRFDEVDAARGDEPIGDEWRGEGPLRLGHLGGRQPEPLGKAGQAQERRPNRAGDLALSD